MPTAIRKIKETLKSLPEEEKAKTIKDLVLEKELSYWRREVLLAYRDRDLGN